MRSREPGRVLFRECRDAPGSFSVHASRVLIQTADSDFAASSLSWLRTRRYERGRDRPENQSVYEHQKERIIQVPYRGPGTLADDPLLLKMKAQGWIVMSAFLHEENSSSTVSLRLVRSMETGGTPPQNEEG